MIKYSQALIPPKAPEILYRSELYKLIKAMIKDYKSVIALYTAKRGQLAMDSDNWVTTDVENKMKELGRKWGKKFGQYAESHSPKYVNKLLKMSNTQLKSVLKDWLADTQLKLIGQVIPVPVRQVVKASIAYNVSLVTSIATEYHEKVFGALMRSITGGGSLEELTHQIHKYGVKELWRARLIANDQTRKTYAAIQIQSCKHYGVTKMQWRHSYGDKHPRDFHIRKWDGVSSPQDPNGLNGLIFDINTPPLIQKQSVTKTGRVIPAQYGYPTDLINCYHKDTEVYTERGFVPIKDVFVGEKVLTLNPYTKQPEWSVCNGTVSKFVEKIVSIKNRWFELKTDINHRFFVYKPYYSNNKNPIGIKPDFIDGVYNLPKQKTYFYGSSCWTGTKTDFVEIGSQKIPLDDYLVFMGYYLSEGSFDNRKTAYRIEIAQQKYTNYMFEKLAYFAPHKTKKAINIYNKDLKEYVKQFGKSYQKFVPEFIKTLPADKIRVFLDAFALGDGTIAHNKVGNLFAGRIYNRYYTSSKRLADDLVELIIKCGKGVSCAFKAVKGKKVAFKNGLYETKTDMYIVCEKKTTNYNLSTMKIKQENYNDIVYDISVADNHTLLVKYKSSIAWNSNCTCYMRAVME